MPLMKEKRVQVAGVELALALEWRRVEQLKRSLPFRYAVQPARHWLAKRAANATQLRDGTSHALNGRSPSSGPLDPEAQLIAKRLEGVDWYHVIDLPHGLSTPGFVDHRGQVGLYGLPDDMTGARALDVATYDGFWAFEMERRGATVVAVDLESMAKCDFPLRLRDVALANGADRPTGAGFSVAADLLQSRVERRLSSVYDLSPTSHGLFDVVFLSDLLLHLRDPFGALERVFTVVKPDGRLILGEPFNPELEAYRGIAVSQFVMANEFWWLPGVACLKRMLEFAGFQRVDELARFRLNARVPIAIDEVVLHAFPNPGA